jgi:hypothetical protein
MSSLTTEQTTARDELVAYLKTLGLDGLEPDEFVDSAEGILEWNLERHDDVEVAVEDVQLYGYSEEEAKKIVEIVHRNLKK